MSYIVNCKTMFKMNISTKIRKVRELKGYSQAYIATELGISQSAYCQIEKDDKNLTIDRIQKVSNILDIDPMELINFNEQQIFNNCKNGNFGTNINSNYYAYSENERMLYEKSIDRLEREVDFLKRSIEGFDKKH